MLHISSFCIFCFLLTYPALDYVGLPDELKEGRVVDEAHLAAVGRILQGPQLVLQSLTALGDRLSIVVTLLQRNICYLCHLH